MSMLQREKRLTPLNVPADQEVESSHLKFLAQPPPGWNYVEAMARFNANVSYSGLVHAGRSCTPLLYTNRSNENGTPTNKYY